MTTSHATPETTPALEAQRPSALVRLRRLLPYALAVLAVVLWWPAGWQGAANWWQLPLQAGQGMVLFLGALSASSVVAALCKEPWVRFGVVVALAALSWSNTPQVPADGTWAVLAGLLAVGSLLGLWLGARAGSGLPGLALVLAALAGLSPSQWPHGPVLAVALAVPVWLAARDKVAPTMWAILRVLLVFVVTSVLRVGLLDGWAASHRAGLRPTLELAHRLADQSAAALRSDWLESARTALLSMTGWYSVAAVLAVVLVAARVLRSRHTSSAG